MQRYWSSLLRHCPWNCFCWLPNFVDIQLPALLSNMLDIEDIGGSLTAQRRDSDVALFSG